MTMKELGYRPINFIINVKKQLNLNDDESVVFDCTVKNMSRFEIANRIGCCEKKVTTLKKRIEKKMEYLE